MILRVAFDGRLADATEARRQMAEFLARAGFVGDVPGALLLGTDLVTNAIRRGAPPFAGTGKHVWFRIGGRLQE